MKILYFQQIILTLLFITYHFIITKYVPWYTYKVCVTFLFLGEYIFDLFTYPVPDTKSIRLVFKFMYLVSSYIPFINFILHFALPDPIKTIIIQVILDGVSVLYKWIFTSSKNNIRS